MICAHCHGRCCRYAFASGGVQTWTQRTRHMEAEWSMHDCEHCTDGTASAQVQGEAERLRAELAGALLENKRLRELVAENARGRLMYPDDLYARILALEGKKL